MNREVCFGLRKHQQPEAWKPLSKRTKTTHAAHESHAAAGSLPAPAGRGAVDDSGDDFAAAAPSPPPECPPVTDSQAPAAPGEASTAGVECDAPATLELPHTLTLPGAGGAVVLYAKIGEGSFKTVYRARMQDLEVAVVCTKTGNVVTEASLMRRLAEHQHPNIARLYGLYPDCMVMELAAHGSLDHILADANVYPNLAFQHKVCICEQICSAMFYLSQLGYLHRDLAARNVLVHSLNPILVKVSDFGLACRYGRGSRGKAGGAVTGGSGGGSSRRSHAVPQPQRRDAAGTAAAAAARAAAVAAAAAAAATAVAGTGGNTSFRADARAPSWYPKAATSAATHAAPAAICPIAWAAPELFSGSTCSEKSDVWSFGVLMWEVWSAGGQPFAMWDLSETKKYLMAGKRLPKPKGCLDKVYRLMRSCWAWNPHERPSFKQLHEVLTQWLGSSSQAHHDAASHAAVASTALASAAATQARAAAAAAAAAAAPAAVASAMVQTKSSSVSAGGGGCNSASLLAAEQPSGASIDVLRALPLPIPPAAAAAAHLLQPWGGGGGSGSWALEPKTLSAFCLPAAAAEAAAADVVRPHTTSAPAFDPGSPDASGGHLAHPRHAAFGGDGSRLHDASFLLNSGDGSPCSDSPNGGGGSDQGIPHAPSAQSYPRHVDFATAAGSLTYLPKGSDSSRTGGFASGGFASGGFASESLLGSLVASQSWDADAPWWSVNDWSLSDLLTENGGGGGGGGGGGEPGSNTDTGAGNAPHVDDAAAHHGGRRNDRFSRYNSNYRADGGLCGGAIVEGGSDDVDDGSDGDNNSGEVELLSSLAGGSADLPRISFGAAGRSQSLSCLALGGGAANKYIPISSAAAKRRDG